MRNMMRPDTQMGRPQVVAPNMPNQYTTPNVAPFQQSQAPYVYMKKRQDDPMRRLGLLKAFRNIGKSAQQKTNNMRHPSDAMRGY